MYPEADCGLMESRVAVIFAGEETADAFVEEMRSLGFGVVGWWEEIADLDDTGW